MKRKYVATSFFLASILTFGGLVGCTPPSTSTSEVKEFYFTAVLDTGANFMNLGTTAKVVISEYNGDENITRRYSYMSTDTSLVTVTEAQSQLVLQKKARPSLLSLKKFPITPFLSISKLLMPNSPRVVTPMLP